MGRERVNAQPALSKPQRSEKSADIGKHIDRMC